MTHLETDYLIVGAGAVGMAFADTILHETDADIILVDKHHKCGGHWNVAYPFVTLHQPSQFYGVSSKELSKGRVDEIGLNKGLADLATGADIMAYFDEVMNHTFLPSGRVRFFPMCDYVGGGEFKHRLTGETFNVDAKKTVDATWLKTSVPAEHTPNFTIEDGVQFMPLNDLPKIAAPPAGFVVIGGGKTGIDACLWLLEHGVAPKDIQWVKSRDAWLLDRQNTQVMEQHFGSTMGSQAGQMESIANATSITDMFDRLEDCGYFVRVDKDVRPTMFHGATISQLELERLQTLIPTIVRKGRVSHVGLNEIILDKGTIPTSPNHIHIDCSASAITNAEIKPIFEGDLITPQTVRSYQPVFSAAFIAHIEGSERTEAQKNQICGVVPLPNADIDYIRFTAAFMMNQYQWGQDPEIRAWLKQNRLDGFSEMVSGIAKDDLEKQAIMKRLRDHMMPAMANIQKFMAQIG